MENLKLFFMIANVILFFKYYLVNGCNDVESLVGDPGMKRDGLRLAFEAWNFCNEAGKETPYVGSPRAADCFDLTRFGLHHKVSEAHNKLGVGNHFLVLT